jgi:hypothetical protein
MTDERWAGGTDPGLQPRPRDGDEPARYANWFVVGQNAFEFVLEFGQQYDDRAAALVHTRIATSPGYAKTLARLLADALAAHERANGVIQGA